MSALANSCSSKAKNFIILLGTLLLLPLYTSAQPDTKQKINVDSVYEGSWNGRIVKVCIGDQFYLVGVQSYGPSAITPALRDGKPEQCEPKAPSKKVE